MTLCVVHRSYPALTSMVPVGHLGLLVLSYPRGTQHLVLLSPTQSVEYVLYATNIVQLLISLTFLFLSLGAKFVMFPTIVLRRFKYARCIILFRYVRNWSSH